MNRTSSHQYTHFELISQVIRRLCEPDGHRIPLEELATQSHMSPSHFQKCFKQYLGVSPEMFQQNLILECAKLALQP